MTTRENISTGSFANDGTGDTLRSAGGKINRNFVKIWQVLGNDSNSISSSLSLEDSAIRYEGSSFTTRALFEEPTADRLINIPDASGSIVLDSSTNTLLNKTLNSPVLDLPQINDSDGSFQYTLTPAGGLAADRSVILPVLTSDDTLVFEDATQTLSNKTMDSATLNNPLVSGLVEDGNGASWLSVGATGSAVNYVKLSNAATGNSPILEALGSDSDVGIQLQNKNGGSVEIKKGAYTAQTVTADGGTPKNFTFIDCNKGTALALSLADGGTVGEFKIYSNRGAGTLTVTPTNFANGTSFALAQNEAAQVIWDGNNWVMMGNQSVATIS